MTRRSDWRPLASAATLQQRALMLQTARQFFNARNVMEVETPVLTAAGVTDAGIRSMRVAGTDNDPRVWLRSSPEYHMKRMLAAASPDIYQIAKAFRDGEAGARHQPEFTMAEWYRLNFSLTQMIDESCEFISCLFRAISPDREALGKPRKHSYRQLIVDAVGLDPLNAHIGELKTCAATLAGWHESLDAQLGCDRSAWLDFIVSHAILPQLPRDGLQVIRDYPAEQAMLARLDPDNNRVAQRFEVFLHGVELANGFHELTDAAEQRQRFESDNARRKAGGRVTMELDTQLLDALEHGLPDCCGVAVGLDRVLMLAGDYPDLASTLSFLPAH